MAEALEVVRAWIDALNDGDVEQMVVLARDDIVFDTPRGLAHGHDELRAFMERQSYGLALRVIPRRYFGNDHVIVVDGLNELRHVDTGALADSFEGPATFEVHHGRVTRFAAHADLATALRAEGISEDAQLSPE